MAETRIGRAVLEITIDGKQYTTALAEINKKTDEAANRMRGIGQAIDLAVFREFATIASRAIGAVADKIVELGSRGADVQDVAGSFEVLTSKAGETASVMLGQLRQGVVGTISDFELMQLANKTLGTGIIKTSSDMGTLAAGARVLAKATGGTTAEAFDTLTSAMASGRTAALKQLGLFVDSKKATEDYAASIGKSVSELTDADRIQALAAASLTALRDRLRDIPPDAQDFGEKVQAAKVQLQNFWDQVAVGVSQSPVLTAGLDAIGKAFSVAFGMGTTSLIDSTVRLIEKLVIGLTFVGTAATTAASIFVTAWSALQTVVLAVETAFVGTLAVWVRMIEAIAQFGAALPGITPEMQRSAASVTALRSELDAMTVSLAQQTAEAAKGVIGQGALHAAIDKVAGGIVNVRDAMSTAQAASGPMGSAVQAAFGAIGPAAETASVRSKEATNAIRDAFFNLTRDIALDQKSGNARRLAELEFAKQAEIQKVREMKEITRDERTELEADIATKYAQRTALVNASTDSIKQMEIDLVNEIALAQTFGTEHELLQIQQQQQARLASLEQLKLTNQEAFTTLTTLVTQKYAQMTAAAQGHFVSVEQAAASAGFKTRDELEKQFAKAKSVYERMLASDKFTKSEMLKAQKAMREAEAALDEQVFLSKEEQLDTLLSSTSTILTSIFGKNKTAAIAAALIDAAAAIVKVFAQFGFFGFVPAAAIAAQTARRISQIRSTNANFAGGTSGLDFQSFGMGTPAVLHGQEAVIPQGKGHLLAGEIASAMPRGSSDDASLSRLDRIAMGIESLPITLKRAVSQGMALAAR